jgi:hypothetical protein
VILVQDDVQAVGKSELRVRHSQRRLRADSTSQGKD